MVLGFRRWCYQLVLKSVTSETGGPAAHLTIANEMDRTEALN